MEPADIILAALVFFLAELSTVLNNKTLTREAPALTGEAPALTEADRSKVSNAITIINDILAIPKNRKNRKKLIRQRRRLLVLLYQIANVDSRTNEYITQLVVTWK